MRLDAFEMGRLKSIAGVRWDDFIQNEVIREKLCQPPVSFEVEKSEVEVVLACGDDGRGTTSEKKNHVC